MKVECKKHFLFHEADERCPDCRAIEVEAVLAEPDEPEESAYDNHGQYSFEHYLRDMGMFCSVQGTVRWREDP